MAPPVQEDKDRGLQCGEMYNCVLPKESRHHPSLDFLEMVGRKPQAGKRKGEVRRRVCMWRGAYLAALAPGCGRTSYKLPPPPTLTRKKGQNLGFSASLTPIWENAPENITTYFQGPPLPGFYVSFCIHRNNPRH